MKFAIIGGTHGNEPVGIKVIQQLNNMDSTQFTHEFKTFLANPQAYKMGKRYVDSDLNRAFSSIGTAKGYEKIRSAELVLEIDQKFDFILDLHTTTSNMGITIILTHLDDISLQATCYLKEMLPELKIIISMRAGGDCPYTTSMAKSGLTVEVGPVANNVISAKLVLSNLDIIKKLLNYDFKKTYDYTQFECFKTMGVIIYPKDGDWMVHPNVDGHDFKCLKTNDPLFINSNGDIIPHEDGEIFPLFVNEAAYQENNTAMEYSQKMNLNEAIIKTRTR